MDDHAARSTKIRILASVSHERLDDEVIAINLETGAYFAFDGAAADCWTIADQGGSAADIAATLVQRYSVSEDTALADVTRFLDDLVRAGIAQPLTGDSEIGVVDRSGPPDERRVYVTPIVDIYDDLETLLLLDPIHEVDDAGWPLPADDNHS